jgi:hypothetical protein
MNITKIEDVKPGYWITFISNYQENIARRYYEVVFITDLSFHCRTYGRTIGAESHYDTVIVGGGIGGIMAAYQLRNQGKVLLIEKGAPLSKRECLPFSQYIFLNISST